MNAGKDRNSRTIPKQAEKDGRLESKGLINLMGQEQESSGTKREEV